MLTCSNGNGWHTWTAGTLPLHEGKESMDMIPMQSIARLGAPALRDSNASYEIVSYNEIYFFNF